MITLALNILDIVQNSIRAEAKEISIKIHESINGDFYRIVIEDNGKGIPAEILKNVTDPFVTTRTKRRMGLGLPLLKYQAELAEGTLEISSEPGKGTIVTSSFSNSHIDRQPLGDITGVIRILLAGNSEVNFTYNHKTDSGEYLFSSSETKDYLEIESLTGFQLLEDISDMINENLKEIKASGILINEYNQ